MKTPFSVVVIGCSFAVAVGCHASFEEFHWTNRLILVDARGQVGPAFASAFDSAREDALRERKLRVFILGKEGVSELRRSGPQEARSLRKRDILSALARSDIALLGLDGMVKERYSMSSFSWVELFSRIDAMPMRRLELGRKEYGL